MALIELDEPSCELLLQYCNAAVVCVCVCVLGKGGIWQWAVDKRAATVIERPDKQWMTVFYRPVKRQTILQ